MANEEQELTKEEKKKKKQEAKAARKANYEKFKQKEKANKKERNRLLNLYADKQKQLKQEYYQQLQSPNANKKQLKKKYQEDLWNLHNQRDYALVPYQGSDKNKDKAKMKVDKRIAFKRYDEQKKLLDEDKKKRFKQLDAQYKVNKKQNRLEIHLAKLQTTNPALAVKYQHSKANEEYVKQYDARIATAKKQYEEGLKAKDANQEELNRIYQLKKDDAKQWLKAQITIENKKQEEATKLAIAKLEEQKKAEAQAKANLESAKTKLAEEYQVRLKKTEADYQTNLKEINKIANDPQLREKQSNAKKQYSRSVNEIKKWYASEKENLKKQNESPVKQQLSFLLQKKLDIKNNYESQTINTKIWYRNTLIQLKTRRDLSYQYELDSGYLFNRWFYGVGKEFQRMSWPTPKKTIKDFFITIIVAGLIAAIFLLIDYLVNLL